MKYMACTLCWLSQTGFDVMNCLDLMENSEFLKKLKFGIGDGTLNVGCVVVCAFLGVFIASLTNAWRVCPSSTTCTTGAAP